MNASEGNLIPDPNRSHDALTQLRGQFRTVLDLPLPGDGNELLPIGTTGWPHYPHLKTGIFSWTEECRRQGYQTRQTRIFGPGVILAQVTVQHLVDDYWLLETRHGGVNEWGQVEVVTGPPVAQVILRIRGSGDNLLDDVDAVGK